MLRFQTAPDPIFLELLHSAIEMTIDDLATSSELVLDMNVLLPFSSLFFTVQEARAQLLLLRQAFTAKEWFEPRSYHWLLLYEALQSYCALFNDGPFGALAERHGIRHVEVNAVVDLFFWNTTVVATDRVQDMRSFLTRRPHPDELVLIPCSPIESRVVSWLFIPGSNEYPSRSLVPSTCAVAPP